jgi:hypothetical protein
MAHRIEPRCGIHDPASGQHDVKRASGLGGDDDEADSNRKRDGAEYGANGHPGARGHLDLIAGNPILAWMFSPSSKARLTAHDLDRFPGDTLFDRIARATCEAECLPRKELYEAWEVARRVRRVFRGGRIVDLAAGHGLLAQMLLILDHSSPTAIAVDTVLPPSTARLHEALSRTWPHLSTRVTFEARSLDSIELYADDVVVSSHACGALTDLVIDRAIAARARVAVLPCCHVFEKNDQGALSGWVDGALAIDIMRVVKLEQNGYHVRTQTIPASVTPKNRLLIATT